MKKAAAVILALVLCALMCAGALAADSEKVCIVIPAEAEDTVSYAAQTLSQYLSPLTGTEVPVITEGGESGGREIHIGKTSKAKFADSEMTDGSYVIKGHDGIVEINGGGTHGYIFGVQRFLKEFCGYSCYSAELGMKTAQTEFSFPLDADIDYSAFFEYSSTDWHSPRDTVYSLANGLNTNTSLTPEQGGYVGYISGFCHTLSTQFCSQGTYFEEHPEYFALRDGKRDGSQLCLTNEDVYKIVLDEVMALIKERHDPSAALQIVSLTQNDNFNYCTCENCRALDDANGSHAGTMITFVNKIAKEVAAAGYDNIAIDTFAYQYTRQAPTAVVPEPNVIVRFCTIEGCFVHTLDDKHCKRNAELMRDLADWGKICNHIYVWDYTTNYAYTCSFFPDFNVIQRNMQIFSENGVNGVYEEGNYYMDNCNTEFGELRCYLLCRLMLDPYCDLDAEMKGFCEAFYGSGGECIIGFIRELCENAAKKDSIIYSRPKDTFSLRGSDVKKLDALWAKAKELSADDSTALENIARSEISWRYVKSSLSVGEFFPTKRAEANKQLYADILATGITQFREFTAGTELPQYYYLQPADRWTELTTPGTVISILVSVALAIAALAVCIVSAAVRKNCRKRNLINLLFFAISEAVLYYSASLYIPWSKIWLFGILAGVLIAFAGVRGVVSAKLAFASGKKQALSFFVHGVIYAFCLMGPIVIINVIISGGSRNGVSMGTSLCLCAVYEIINAAAQKTKK